MDTFFIPEHLSAKTSVGKGSDSVIGMLHHKLMGLMITDPVTGDQKRPKHLKFECDNCSGQASG